MLHMHYTYTALPILGRFEEALSAAQEIHTNLPDDLLADPVMNKFFECFRSIELHVLLRFGKWDRILAMPPPADTKVC